MFTDVRLFVKSFLQKIQRDRIYNFSASSAFFIILSIFPFLILLLTIVQFTPLTEEFLLKRIEFISPTALFPLLKQIVIEIYTTTHNVPLILFSALGGIWSASKGIMAMIRGINVCFNIDDRRNYFRVRILSCIYTLIFIVAIVFLLILLVFGSVFYGYLQENFFEVYSFLKFIIEERILISLVIMTLFLMLVYKFLPARNNKFLLMFPGAIVGAGALIGLSELASLYVRAFPNFSYTYGSLTSFILLMIFLYFTMYIIFICAEINFFFKSWIEKVSARRKRRKALKYEEKNERKMMKAQSREGAQEAPPSPDNPEDTKIYKN